MKASHPLIWGLLGVGAIGTFSWQNRVASERMVKVAEQVDQIARTRSTVKLVAPQPLPPWRDAVPESKPPEAPPPDSTAEQERKAAVHRDAEDVIRSGQLRREDVARLAPQLDSLPRAEAMAVRAQIADAINKQELIPTEVPFDLP